MLYVFYVVNGIMMKFDMQISLFRVQKLKDEIEKKYSIPNKNIILLTSCGHQLEDESLVGKYSATDANPIYMFCSTSTGNVDVNLPNCNCNCLQNKSCNCGRSETDLTRHIEDHISLQPTFQTVKDRAVLARQIYTSATKEELICEELIQEQILQKNGWSAVITNLESLTSAFIQRFENFDDFFKSNLEKRPRHLELIKSFEHDLHELSKIPVLPNLLPLARKEFTAFENFIESTNDSFYKKSQIENISSTISSEENNSNSNSNNSSITLLQWITAKQNPNLLNSLAEECAQSLNAFTELNLEALKTSFSNIVKNAKNDDYKAIKGLETRLMHLQKLFETLKTKVQDQKDLSASFQMNKSFGSTTGDSSILEDLCASHQNQLGVMLKNYIEIREIRIKIIKSKQELCDNLYERLKFIVKIENSMSDSDNTHLFYYRVLSRSEKHLEVMEQINKTPLLYLAASTEVQRRSIYSELFLKWCAKISKELEGLNNAEINRRKNFNAMFENHFLVNLFPGMEDMPPRFSPEIPSKLDCNLPKITQSDIDLLKTLIPHSEVETFNSEYLKQFFDTRNWNILETADVEGNIYNALDPVKVSGSSDNQVPIIEESTWGNNDTTMEPEKVETEETPIDKSLLRPEVPHVAGTTLKNLNFRRESRQSSDNESTLKPSQKSAVIENCRKGDVVICYWNSEHQQYGIIQDSSCLYFVHGESLNELNLQIPPRDNPAPFIFGVITDKEYCQAKKDENRYKVEKGTKFFRVKVAPLSRRTSVTRKDQDERVSQGSDLEFLEVSNRKKDLLAKLSGANSSHIEESQMIMSSTSLEAPSNLSHSIGLFTLIEPVLSSIRNMDLE